MSDVEKDKGKRIKDKMGGVENVRVGQALRAGSTVQKFNGSTIGFWERNFAGSKAKDKG